MSSGSPCLLAVNNYFYPRGGADVLFLEQNRIFEQIGWQVVPFAMRHPDNLPSAWAEYFPDEIEYGRTYGLRESFMRAHRVVFSLQARRKIGALIDRVNPRLAHIHNVYHHLSPAILPVLKQRGVAAVMTIHDLKLLCPSRRMMIDHQPCARCKGGALHHAVINRCIKGSLALSSLAMLEGVVQRTLRLYESNIAVFVTPSRFLLEMFVRWGWARERLVYIPNFVDVDRFRSETATGRRFVYCGRLDKDKGVATLVRAAARARQPVTIVGSGPDELELRSLAASLGADVEFCGRLSGSELAAAFAAARAVVLPSECYENAPLSVLEAYAAGRPVVGAAIGGVPELIRQDDTGFLFPSGNAEALAAILSRLAAMPATKLAAIGASGRRWVERDFSAAVYRTRILALYESLSATRMPA